MTDTIILKTEKLNKTFLQGRNRIHVLKDINLSIKKGETIALVGPSGCGKTTLLQLLGLLDKPDSGKIFIKNIDYNAKDESERTKCRLKNLGFIYQSYNLLGDFTALENTIMPLLIANIAKKEAILKGQKLLASLGMQHRMAHYPSQLSGGEQQRIAIARSLIHQPELILADEPTGNLDRENAEKVINILIDAVKKMNKSLVIVTHNLEIVKNVNNVLTLNQSKIVSKNES